MLRFKMAKILAAACRFLCRLGCGMSDVIML